MMVLFQLARWKLSRHIATAIQSTSSHGVVGPKSRFGKKIQSLWTYMYIISIVMLSVYVCPDKKKSSDFS